MKRLFTSMIVTSLILSSSLTSCSKIETENSKRGTINEVSSVSSTEKQGEASEGKSEISVLEYISAGIKDEKSSYVYNGEKISIEYQYSAVGSKSVGIMVLCDGIAVPFSTDSFSEESLLQIIPNTSNGDIIDIVLNFTPIGAEGDSVSVEIVDIVEPDFDIYSLDLTQTLTPLIQGKKYLANYISGINISMMKDGFNHENDICTTSEITEISTEEIDRNKVINDDGTVSNQLQYFSSEWTVNNEKSLVYSVAQGDKLDISITYSGTEGQNILTSFYIDNKPFPVFDSCNYSQCFVDDEHFTAITGQIDTSKLEKGRYICYSICGNVENSITIPTSAFIIEVK